KIVAEEPNFKKTSRWTRDMVNVFTGIIWQTAIITIPIYFVLKKFYYAAICLVIILTTSFFLKKNWYDKMETD
ncbi:MAG: sodium:solute symporter, partial [Candidatus Marinimicrobia bacterium]|nr:sodium:solute symporter [Candidatus Neomarinimicrobiota bacterium]